MAIRDQRYGPDPDRGNWGEVRKKIQAADIDLDAKELRTGILNDESAAQFWMRMTGTKLFSSFRELTRGFSDVPRAVEAMTWILGLPYTAWLFCKFWGRVHNNLPTFHLYLRWLSCSQSPYTIREVHAIEPLYRAPLKFPFVVVDAHGRYMEWIWR